MYSLHCIGLLLAEGKSFISYNTVQKHKTSAEGWSIKSAILLGKKKNKLLQIVKYIKFFSRPYQLTCPCVPISVPLRLKSLLETCLSFLRLSEISVVKRGRGVLRRVRIDQIFYNVAQWSCELEMPLPTMTRYQITIWNSLSAFKEIDFISSL